MIQTIAADTLSVPTAVDTAAPVRIAPKVDTSAFIAEVMEHQRETRKRERANPLLPSLNAGLPFRDAPINLAKNAAGSTPNAGDLMAELNVRGHKLIYRRDNSHPQGRLLVEFGGGKFADMVPGAMLDAGPSGFDSLRVYQSANGINLGNAQLLIVERPDIDYREPYTSVPGLLFQPIDLLGTSAATAVFVGNGSPSNIDNIQPTLAPASQAGAFRIDGLSQIRGMLDMTAANVQNMLIVPWTYELNSGLWLSQDGAQMQIPGPQAAQRYRLFTMPVVGNGWMFLEMRNTGGLHPALIVQGIA